MLKMIVKQIYLERTFIYLFLNSWSGRSMTCYLKFFGNMQLMVADFEERDKKGFKGYQTLIESFKVKFCM